MKLTYKQLSDQNFLSAISQLANERLPVKTAYTVKKIADSVMSVRKRIGAEYLSDVIEKYAKKNPDGSVCYLKDSEGREDKTAVDLEESTKVEFALAQEGFGTREAEISQPKIFLEQLQNIEISASVLSYLDPILTEMTLVSGGEAQVSQIKQAQGEPAPA